MEAKQNSLFDFPKMEITKPIRLIELFGGIGSQAMALRDIGANFEHYKLIEFDKYAVASYNAIHGTNHTTHDIRDVHGQDLEITETEKYCYLMTYSFPCTDLSVAGKMAGMSKAEWAEGKATRSGLLWEVERILKELPKDQLPQVLLMENVPQVHAEKNEADFNSWLDFLNSKGYINFYDDLNAKDYGIPQNRDRCFCVSILTEEFMDFQFPNKIPLEKVMKDYLEETVDEKYYVNTTKAGEFISQLKENGLLPEQNRQAEQTNDCRMLGMLGDEGFEKVRRVYSTEALCPTIQTKEDRIKMLAQVKWVTVPQKVTVRKNKVDIEGLKDLLAKAKESSGLSIKEITEKLEISQTKVEHYFRKDSCFAGPDPEVWPEIKKVLNITTDEFDKAIMEFETRTGVYEKSERCYSTDHLSPALTTQCEHEKIIEDTRCVGGLTENQWGNQYHQQDRVYKGDVALAHPANIPDGSYKYITKDKTEYRIRKLTPKECWRLMGYTDADFEKAQVSGVSNRQLYKQAGNAIVKQVLMAIFRQMIPENCRQKQ